MGEGHDRNSSSGVVRLHGEHILLEGGVCPIGRTPLCPDGEELLTWSAVLALGRRVVAVLLLRWGLWNTSTVSYGRRCDDEMRCRAAWSDRGWVWGEQA